MKLVTAAEMRELDRRTIEDVGVPSAVLMENAGRSTYQVLRREFADLSGPVVILAGRGNNGGDGLVVARYLANDGFPVSVFLFTSRDQVRGDALVNLSILEAMGLEVEEVLGEDQLSSVGHRVSRAALVVDALLGTGLNSPVRGLLSQVIARVNQLRTPVLAVDIPSGLSADTGESLGVAVAADVTVTYGFTKLGQILPPGRDLVGRLWLVDISIPPALTRDLKTELAEAAEMRSLLPPRPFASHKGTFGGGRFGRKNRGRHHDRRSGITLRDRAGHCCGAGEPERHFGSEAHRGHDPPPPRGRRRPSPGAGGPHAFNKFFAG